jgi:hypothetical protein
MKQLLFFLFSLLVSVSVFSQKSAVASYLDDNGRSNARNILKLEVSEILKSNIQLIWEHSINENFSLETSVGFLVHGSFKPILNKSIGDELIYENLSSGFSLGINPVINVKGLESLRYGIPFKLHYHFGQAISYELCMTIGKQWFLTRNIALEIGGGIGLNIETSLDDYSYIFDSNLRDRGYLSVKDDVGARVVIPVFAKIGYVF